MMDEPSQVSVVNYNKGTFSRRTLDPDNLEQPPTIQGQTTWVHLRNAPEELVRAVAGLYDLHHLLVEDILNPAQLPKCETFGDYIYLVLRPVVHREDGLQTERLDLVVHKDLVLTFRQGRCALVEPIVQRLEQGKGRLRQRKADHLVYALLDLVVSQYMDVVLVLELESERLQAVLLDRPRKSTLDEVFNLRGQLAVLRREGTFTRSLVADLIDDCGDMLQKGTGAYLRDVADHTRWLMDGCDALRDTLRNTVDLYMVQVNRRISEVMKVLAMISTIFIPLNLIAAVYGMNFKNMPELHLQWGYFGVLGLMVTLAGGMLLVFWKKGWL